MKLKITLVVALNWLIFNGLAAQIEINPQAESDKLHISSPNTPLSIKSNLGVISTGFKVEQSEQVTLSHPLATLSEPSNALKFDSGDKFKHLITMSDTFNRKRFWTLIGSTAVAYTGAVLALNNVWYAQYPRSSFHFFDDIGEWYRMDKAGHVLVAAQEAKWIFGLMRWSGVENNRAAWLGMGAGMLFQTTLEVMDGFSTEWGFSWSDMAANTLGAAAFGIQQATWGEQRLIFKVSNTPMKYSTAPIRSIDGSKTTTLEARANDLFGDNYAQTFFKDYNALIFWLSVNPKSFIKNSNLPSWLNIAVGYSAENLFGGFRNEWPADKPEFRLSSTDYPRFQQFYLSFDIDLSRIKTKSKFLRALGNIFNFIKIPSPTLEFNSLGKFTFHPLLF